MLYEDNELCLTREQVWEELTRRNAAKAVVHFSGGNDEGSVSRIELVDANGAEIGELQEIYAPTEWSEKEKKWVRKTQPTQEELLVNALVRPVYDKYYSFAGEYYVEGTVTFNVANRTAHMEASETVESYEPVDEEV